MDSVHLTFSQISKPHMEQQTDKNYDLKVMGVRDWRQKSQDGDQRRAIVEEAKIYGAL